MGRRSGVRKSYQAGAFRRAGSPPGTSLHRSESYSYAERIAAALDPTAAPGKVRTLADMTPEERAEMVRLYAKPPTK